VAQHISLTSPAVDSDGEMLAAAARAAVAVGESAARGHGCKDPPV
jgi:hypothetical protein